MTYSQILTALRRAGFRVTDKETTPGAKKAWLDPPSYLRERAACMAAVALALPCTIYPNDGFQCRGNGFEAEFQTYPEKGPCLFVAVYQKTRRGLAYEMGVDC